MTRDEQLDYLAGFFDADGSITGVFSCGIHLVRLVVAQCTPTVPNMFKDVFGGAVRVNPSRGDNWRDSWHWYQSCSKNSTLPFLLRGRMVVRSRQLELAIKMVESRKRQGGNGKLNETEEEKEIRSVRPKDFAYRTSILTALTEANGGKFDDESIRIRLLSSAYWAGFFDGDGSVRANKDTNSRVHRPVARFYSNYQPILNAAKSEFGGTIRYNVHGKRCHTWEGYHKGAEVLLRRIQPYVIEKKERVERAIEILNLIQNGEKTLVPKKRHAVWTFNDCVIQRMNEIVGELAVLNRRGRLRGISFEEIGVCQ